MFPQKSQLSARAEPKTYTLDEDSGQAKNGPAMALLALSHTPVEHRLYGAMLNAVDEKTRDDHSFTARQLMALTEIRSLSSVRRGIEGLVAKLSIERKPNGSGPGERGASYRVYAPEEIIARRNDLGITCAASVGSCEINHAFERVLNRVVENGRLSRREAQVTLSCLEGLTNAEIGKRLQVSEQTVKFHLRSIFIKFGVRRRAELISRLLM